MRAYRETIDWMYAGAAALDVYADYAKLPTAQVRNVREYIPKSAVDPGRIAGMGEIIADAVAAEVHRGALDRAAGQGAGADAGGLGLSQVPADHDRWVQKTGFSEVDNNMSIDLLYRRGLGAP